MPANKRSKKSRNRGSTTHGQGHGKKNRGAGNRGGRGGSGIGKRSGHKKPSFMQEDGEYGSSGFTPPSQDDSDVINLEDIEERLPTYLEEGLIDEEDDMYVLDVSELGYDKVLGSGGISEAMRIKADNFSSSAKERIEEAGGEPVEKED